MNSISVISKINKQNNFSFFTPSSYGVTGYSSTKYTVYTFTSTTTTYTIPYTCKKSNTMYILAVGGGGAGGSKPKMKILFLFHFIIVFGSLHPNCFSSRKR
jgi:hypothetical protein